MYPLERIKRMRINKNRHWNNFSTPIKYIDKISPIFFPLIEFHYTESKKLKILAVTRPSVADYANKPGIEYVCRIGKNSRTRFDQISATTCKNKKSSNEDEIIKIKLENEAIKQIEYKNNRIEKIQLNIRYDIILFVDECSTNVFYSLYCVKENHKIVTHRMTKRRELATIMVHRACNTKYRNSRVKYRGHGVDAWR